MNRTRTPSARSVRRAVDLLAQLPAEVLGQLAEAFIDRLDAAEAPTIDLEAETDCCPAGDDQPDRGGEAYNVLPWDDADLEHSLGWSNPHAGALHGAPEGGEDPDLEEDDEPEDDDPQGDMHHDAEGEPSLGWPGGGASVGCTSDREADGSDDEPDDDDMGSAEDEPQFPLRRTELRAARDGLVTVHRRTIPFVMITSKGGRPTGVITMVARRFP